MSVARGSRHPSLVLERDWWSGRRGLSVLAVASLGALASLAGAAAAARPAAPPPLVQIARGPGGGTVWQGLIRDPGVPALRRPTVVYLPPGYSDRRRYPVVYLLQGFPGSPYEFLDGLRLAEVADRAIARLRLPAFIAVAPPAGLDAHHGDWTGEWESYLVDDVVPWVDAHLPTEATSGGRTLAGLSAGGYGAIDIGLRHALLFATLESWSGYFTPLRDGPLHGATAEGLAAHDPTVLVRREARLLARLGTRFFLSSGTTRDRDSARAATSFAAELGGLGLHSRLWLGPGGHDGRFWRAQLPEALRYALGGESRPGGRAVRI
jgi:enterochelin esterase-like enzyme